VALIIGKRGDPSQAPGKAWLHLGYTNFIERHQPATYHQRQHVSITAKV